MATTTTRTAPRTVPVATVPPPARALASASSALASRTEAPAQAAAVRAVLDEAAAAINAHHATVLGAVIAAKRANLHRTCFGFSALRDWLVSAFDFHRQTEV
ncbi:hypothetical protein [Glycomyces albidus]|uniref:Uncharacterized protein n=1 Tax=Glycomyces albidus TaxID=2656774 RepID=A0A6L5GE14_9ACTN|nr:hypothetical protein [Glycomyces albidus]MQM27944.1 hypothetical protein [Glycomyces albidus]